MDIFVSILVISIFSAFCKGSLVPKSSQDDDLQCFVHGELIGGSLIGTSFQKSDIDCLKYSQKNDDSYTYWTFDPVSKVCEIFNQYRINITTSNCPKCISGRRDCTYETCNQVGICKVGGYSLKCSSNVNVTLKSQFI